MHVFLILKRSSKIDLAFLKENNKLVEAQRLQERTQYDLEMMRELVIIKESRITLDIFRRESVSPLLLV